MGPMSSVAGTVVLRQGLNGYSGTSDTTIYRDFPGNSAGGFPYVFAGTNKINRARRGLIRFDLQGAIPATAQITSATLQLYTEFTRGSTFTFTLYPMSAAWNEGANANDDNSGQGAPAVSGDSTWTYLSFSTVAWTTPGGDFGSQASATGVTGAIGTYLEISGAGMVNDLQSWLAAPGGNHGWALLGDETVNTTAKRFYSSEEPVQAALRPQLSIEYSLSSVVQDWTVY